MASIDDTKSKSYYDSEDAQTFYSSIWGEETLHLGRYDLLTENDKSTLSLSNQISKAEELHELEFVKLIVSKFHSNNDDKPKLRVLDMGCGYGGLLRRLWKENLVLRGTGCDISTKMCEKAEIHNAKLGCQKDIVIFEDSYLDVPIPDASVDLVISMDAFLHVGPEGHLAVMEEVTRVLRPGGWLIYSDIMEQEVVDPEEMQPIYDRIHLSKLGTVSNYQKAISKSGLTEFAFEPHSENVSTHYGTVRRVLLEKGESLGLSQDFMERMSSGLATWEKLAPTNIVWGFLLAKKA